MAFHRDVCRVCSFSTFSYTCCVFLRYLLPHQAGHFIFSFSCRREFPSCRAIRQQKERKKRKVMPIHFNRVEIAFLMPLTSIISQNEERNHCVCLKKFPCTEIASHFTKYLLIPGMSIGFYWLHELFIKTCCY